MLLAVKLCRIETVPSQDRCYLLGFSDGVELLSGWNLWLARESIERLKGLTGTFSLLLRVPIGLCPETIGLYIALHLCSIINKSPSFPVGTFHCDAVRCWLLADISSGASIRNRLSLTQT